MKTRLNGIIKNLNNSINTTSSVHNMSVDDSDGQTHKVYQVDEAGDYIEGTYKGITVYVRENYPYYNPQNDTIYYSKEEEAEDLYQIAKEITEPTLQKLDI